MKLYPGTIRKIYSSGNVDVEYDDGDFDKDISAKAVKPLKASRGKQKDGDSDMNGTGSEAASTIAEAAKSNLEKHLNPDDESKSKANAESCTQPN